MIRARLHAVLALFTLGFVGILGRLAYLQVWCHSDLASRANRQSERWVRESPRRLSIVDRNGHVLAESVRVASCYADPTVLANPRNAAERLSPLLAVPATELIKNIRDAPGAFVWLKRHLPNEQALAIERENLKGIGLVWEYRRAYPNGSLAAALLGYVGDDGHGLSGLEHAFDDDLIDVSPARRARRDGRGTRLEDGAEDAPSGELRLTLDRGLQFFAEKELDAALERSRARQALVVIQDPATGEILALASRPTFRLDASTPPDPALLGVPAVQWVFEPGSTFKLVTGAAGLEEGVVRPAERMDCESGVWRYASLTINDHEPEKIIPFSRAMEVSSNIAFSKLGLRLGSGKLYDYIRAFGFGSRAGLEVAGESAGLLKPLAKWSAVSLPVISFGQEVGVTAVQLAGAYSAIANGGTLMEPRLCQSLKRADGTMRTWAASTPIRRVVTPATARTLTELLLGVVDHGTGREAAVAGWSVAGKTGTAQKIDPRTRAYSRDKFTASFCGFVPAWNPRLTIVVIVDEPKGLSWGGWNGGPVFRQVAWQSLIKMGVPLEPGRLLRAMEKGQKNT